MALASRSMSVADSSSRSPLSLATSIISFLSFSLGSSMLMRSLHETSKKSEDDASLISATTEGVVMQISGGFILDIKRVVSAI